MKLISITHLGKNYESITELADTFNLNASRLGVFIKKYNDVDKGVQEALKAKDSRKIKLYNQTFENLTEVATFYGIEYSHLSSYMYMKGMAIEQALEEAQKRGVYFKGKRYETLYLLTQEYNMDANIVSTRMQQGWDLERALEEPIKSYKTDEIYYKGKTFISKSDMLRHYGITFNFVENVSKTYGFDWDKSFDYVVSFLETCEGDRPTIVTTIPYVIYNGMWFKSMEDFCEHIGVTKPTFIGVLKELEDKSAIQAVALLRERRVSIYEYQGKEYMHVELFGILKGKLKGAVRRGEVKKTMIPKYPDIKTPKGYCKDSYYDFRKYMESK